MPRLTAPPVSTRSRLLVSTIIGLAVAAYASVAYARQGPGGMSDFDQVWIAARALANGADPAAALEATGWPFPMLYPATASTLVMPLLLVSLPIARIIFSALGAATLAYALTSRSWWGILALLSGAYLIGVNLVQWSPLLVGATALWPLLAGAVFVAKPTIGFALGVAYLPTTTRRVLWAAVGGAAVLAVSLLLRPSWPAEWLAATAHAPHVLAPVTLLPIGPLLLLALLRWRRPEARLLVALACVPHTITLYETLPLFLVAASPFEVLFLVLATDVLIFPLVISAGAHVVGPAELAAQAHRTGLILVAACYLPCLFMVLRRPNAGAVLGNAPGRSDEQDRTASAASEVDESRT